MTKTVKALYQTAANAERARDALVAAHLGDDVTIDDRTQDDAAKAVRHGAEHDRDFYDEALRRGHFLLTAKVGDLKETRAAEIIDAATPIDLDKAASTWRADGWSPPVAPAPGLVGADPVQISSTVRIYDFIG